MLTLPNTPCGDAGLEHCGVCVVPRTSQILPNSTGFEDHCGRDMYLTALKIKEFPISRACSRLLRGPVFNFKHTYTVLFRFRCGWCAARSNRGNVWPCLI